jgi:hypothetical protein
LIFQMLASRFDQAGAPSAWALTNALLDAHLAASDVEALGGDLAYRYGLSGALTGIGISAAQNIIGSAQFGGTAQALKPLPGLQEGLVKLG